MNEYINLWKNEDSTISYKDTILYQLYIDVVMLDTHNI